MYNLSNFELFSKQSEHPGRPLFHLEVMDVKKVVDEEVFVLLHCYAVQMAQVYIDHSGVHIADDVVNELWVGVVYSFLPKRMVQRM